MIPSNYADMDDTFIWEAFKSGERSAFSYIYFQYAKLLMLYGKKICKDEVLVEDQIHDLFLELWTKRKGLGSTDSIKFYLFKVLRRQLTKTLKKEQSLWSEIEEKQLPFSPPIEAQIINIQDHAERNRIVEKLLLQLNDNQREIIYLKYFSNLTNSEIAEIIEIEHQSVKNILFRTITKIRKYLHQQNIKFPL